MNWKKVNIHKNNFDIKCINTSDLKYNLNECILCLEKFDSNNKIVLNCFHELCINCFFKYISNQNKDCFLCRKKMTTLQMPLLNQAKFFKKLFFKNIVDDKYDTLDNIRPYTSIFFMKEQLHVFFMITFLIFFLYFKIANFFHNQDMSQI